MIEFNKSFLTKDETKFSIYLLFVKKFIFFQVIFLFILNETIITGKYFKISKN